MLEPALIVFQVGEIDADPPALRGLADLEELQDEPEDDEEDRTDVRAGELDAEVVVGSVPHACAVEDEGDGERGDEAEPRNGGLEEGEVARMFSSVELGVLLAFELVFVLSAPVVETNVGQALGAPDEDTTYGADVDQGLLEFSL